MDLTSKALLIAIVLMVVLLVLLPIAKNSKAQKRWDEKNRCEKEEWLKRREQEKKSREIVEVKLLGGGDMEFKRGGLGGALFGGFIGGVPGAVMGAVMPSGKGTQKQKFAVKYADGHVEVVEHTPGTETYKKLMQYVKWEEIQ